MKAKNDLIVVAINELAFMVSCFWLVVLAGFSDGIQIASESYAAHAFILSNLLVAGVEQYLFYKHAKRFDYTYRAQGALASSSVLLAGEKHTPSRDRNGGQSRVAVPGALTQQRDDFREDEAVLDSNLHKYYPIPARYYQVKVGFTGLAIVLIFSDMLAQNPLLTTVISAALGSAFFAFHAVKAFYCAKAVHALGGFKFKTRGLPIRSAAAAYSTALVDASISSAIVAILIVTVLLKQAGNKELYTPLFILGSVLMLSAMVKVNTMYDSTLPFWAYRSMRYWPQGVGGQPVPLEAMGATANGFYILARRLHPLTKTGASSGSAQYQQPLTDDPAQQAVVSSLV